MKSVVDKLQNLKKWAAPEKAKLSLANNTLSLSLHSPVPCTTSMKPFSFSPFIVALCMSLSWI